MKYFIYFPLLAALLSACSPAKTADDVQNAFRGPGGQKPYADSDLTGQVFGQNWSALSAVAVPFGADQTQLTVNFYAEKVSGACKAPITSKPYASIVIPRNYTLTEYSQNPLVFTDLQNGARNVIADQSRLRVNTIDNQGFAASIYAHAIDETGAISEINGKVQVTDCTKVADFSVWKDLVGWYSLKSFDGKPANSQVSIFEMKSNYFYDRSSARYLQSLMIPLYSSVTDNVTSSYSVGPVDGLGTTMVVDKDGVRTLSYSYHGPTNYRSTDVDLAFDLTVVSQGNTLTVTYTLEIPKYINKTTHTFVVSK